MSAVAPEEIGPHACWRTIAVRRESIDPSVAHAAPTREIGYYVGSATAPDG